MENSKNTWKTIHEVINKTENKTLPDYMINDIHVTDLTLIVNHFNKYFAMIGSNVASTIDTPPNCSYKDYLKMDFGTNFKFNTVTEAKVQSIIDQLNSKSSSGYDGISTSLLKKIKWVVFRPLTTIINQSLNTGIFLDKLKLAKIIPVHKKGKQQKIIVQFLCYLPNCSKLFLNNYIHILFNTVICVTISTASGNNTPLDIQYSKLLTE